MANAGAVVRAATTARGQDNGGGPSRSLVTVDADGLVGVFAAGVAVRAATTASGIILSNINGQGLGLRAETEAAGFGLYTAGGTRALPTAAAAGLVGTVGVGTAVRLASSPTISAVIVVVGAGTAVSPYRVASARGGINNVGSGTTARLRNRGAGLGLAGTVGTGSIVAPYPLAAVTGRQEASGAGAATLPRRVAYAAGDAATDGTSRTWAMNTRNNGVTEYTAFPYNSFARFGGAHLAAGATGLYVLEGDDDAGTNIDWAVRTGLHDDKKPVLKRLAAVMLGARSDGPIRVKIFRDDSQSYEYVVPAPGSSEIQQFRVKTGKGIRSRYFMVELRGDGTYVELDSLQLTMPETTRRVG